MQTVDDTGTIDTLIKLPMMIWHASRNGLSVQIQFLFDTGIT